MITKKLFTTIAFAFVLLFSGCADDDFNEIDGLCPLVVSTVPEDGAIDVPLNQIITATFNEKMNPSTITEASFTVANGSTFGKGNDNNALINGTVTYNDSTAVFTPSSLLDENTEYTGTIKTLAKDLRGNALQEDYVWTFVTAAPLPEFSVEVSSNPALGGVTTGGGLFEQGTAVTVTAVPNAGYTFLNWTDNGIEVSTSANYQFLLTADRTLVANYVANQFTVIVSSNPALGGVTAGGGVFNQGATVTVTAVPNAGYTFDNWTDNGIEVSTSVNYQFILAADRTLVANYSLIPASQFAVIVSSNPILGGVTAGGGLFDQGTTVTVTAVPNAGYTFDNWTDNGIEVSTSANYQFLLTTDRTLVANYSLIPASQFAVNLSSSPVEGGSTNGSGSFDAGTNVTVTATANTGYTFVNWTLAGVEVSTNANYTFALNANTTLVANFVIKTYTLQVTSVNGTVAINPIQATYNHGATVVLTPTPATGYEFTSWSGDATGTNNPLTVVMNGNKNITANFTALGLTLNVTAVNGNVVKNPDNSTYNNGDNVVLTATPNSGYEFTSWSGDAAGTDNPLTVLMNANKNITANFSLIATAACTPAVDLGTAGNYVILAESGISTTGTTSVVGDMGIFPAEATYITGFDLILTAGAAYATSSLVTGKIYAPSYAVPTPANLNTAINDMHTAFTTGNGLAAGTTELLAGNLNGQTLAAGVYKWGTGLSITNGITLDGGGDSCAMFVFQIAQDLTVGDGAIITLTNGAKAENIYWLVTGQAVLGTTVQFQGNILSKTLISLNTGATINGRLLAQTAVTLDANSVVKP
ncbi:MAG: ice-binding family protein [Lutibacter sp.]|nr:ice-binding family protein [Lutibacter sp.]